MDVHRCRFVPFQPSAINAIALSHPRTQTARQAGLARMAIGRSNGDIEIWNPAAGSWYQETVIRGGKDRSIDGLVWTTEPDQDLGDGRIVQGRLRLFSIGYTSTVTEWDLETGKPKRHASGQHGDIWCIAAQPGEAGSGTAGINASGTKLVAGTIDGELVLYSVEDGDLRFQRVMVRSPTKKAQMVSIAFQSRRVVIVGCSDGTVRAYDIVKGHLLRRMTLGADLAAAGPGSKDVIVWSVQCLPNGNIVSADSTGHLTIWDGKTYTQTQRIQGHKQDILSLAVSADGSAILSGGMDRRTILYKLNGSRWSKVCARRYHDHDVKAMASLESGHISVVISGGPDANPVVVPLKEMGRENHRVLPNLPQQPPIASARKARFILSWWDRELHIWQLRRTASDMIDSVSAEPGRDGDLAQNRKLLKTIVVKGDSNISSATINDEGTLLVVSTATDVKAFRLDHQDPTRPSDVKLSTVAVPPEVSKAGASKVQLSPDSAWLCTVTDGQRILITKLETNSDDDDAAIFPPKQTRRLTRLRRNVPRHVKNGGLGKYDRTITQIAFSADSKVLATGDLAGYLDTWVLQEAGAGGDDEGASSESDSNSDSDDDETTTSQGTRWVRNPKSRQLPKLSASAVVLSFSEHVPRAAGDEDYTLLVLTHTWQVVALHPLQGSLTGWSRRHPRKALPAPVQDLLDLPKSVAWQGSRAWISGVSFLVMLDLSQDLVATAGDGQTSQAQVATAGLKRKRVGRGTGAGGKMAQSLAPHQVTRHVDGREEDVDVVMKGGEGSSGSSPDDEDDEDESAGRELAQLRNKAAKGANGTAVQTTNPATGADAGRKPWWITYKYRPIFGVVPMGQDEVALVERPIWDVDMQESYLENKR